MPKKKAPPAPLPPAPKPRRARGTGTIMWDKRRNCYLARVLIGRYENGTTRYTEVRGETQAEVVEKMKLVEPPDPNTVTVREWAARWLEGIDVRDSTRAGYVRQVEARILPQLGHVRLAGLTVSQVRQALLAWAADGTATANRTLRVGATMLKAAALDELASRNPFAECPRLKHTPKELDPFTVPELRQLVAAGGGRYASADLVAFLAGTGLRIGEAAALDVTDYDPATGRVSITKTWSRDHGTRPPKSKHSRRTITVPPLARPAVDRAIGGRTQGVLFGNAAGTRFDSAQVYIGLNLLLKRLKLRKRGPHQIRHGVLSALVNSGAPLGDVAKFAGHSVGQLIKTYLHAGGTDPGAALEGLLTGA